MLQWKLAMKIEVHSQLKRFFIDFVSSLKRILSKKLFQYLQKWWAKKHKVISVCVKSIFISIVTFEFVQLSIILLRPWYDPSKESTTPFDFPGVVLWRALFSSSSLIFSLPTSCFLLCQMYIALIAFSFAQVPHFIICKHGNFGDIRSTILSKISGQSALGKTPKAGRLIRDFY